MDLRSLARAALAVLACAAAPAALAVDAPHDASISPSAITCKSCHSAHGALGGALTTVAGNANLCFSCHVSTASPGNAFGFPWKTEDQAVPGSKGVHHRWDANGNQATWGASTTNLTGAYSAMATRLLTDGSGNKLLQCSVCHDQHGSLKDASGNVITANGAAGNAHASLPLGVANAPTNAVGPSTSALTITSITAGAGAPQPRGYRIKIYAAGMFELSSDNGASWFGCTASTTYTYVAFTGANGCSTATANLPLSDTAVTVTFGATAVGDEWKFYVAYPLLRASNADAGMCEACHADRVQTKARVEGIDATYLANGTNVFSHPIGAALDAAPKDRATPFDADGGTQGVNGDSNPMNDVVLPNGKVRCTSCHAPHNADSNSLSVDKR